MLRPDGKVLDVKVFTGLEVETDPLNRTPNSWAELEGWDQFVSGSIRKTEDILELKVGKVYDSPIIAIKSYRRTPGEPLRVIGISAIGAVYDLEATLPTAITSFGMVPDSDGEPSCFVGEMTGIENGDTIKYFVATNGFVAQKWNGKLGVDAHVTPIGTPSPSSIPEDPVNDLVNHVMIGEIAITDDPTVGIPILVSRRYRYTYWNPITRQESSPSADSAVAPIAPTLYSFISPTAAAHPTVLLPYVASIALDGRFLTSFVGQPDYTRFRVYATKDGGDVFYLVDPLVAVYRNGPDPGDFSILVSDVDSSLPIRRPGPNDLPDYILDGVVTIGPFPPVTWVGPTTALNQPPEISNVLIGGAYSPMPDPALVQPAPDPGENDPPPTAQWGAIYQGRLFLLEADNRSRIVFSKIQEFESFPPDNFFNIENSEYDPVIAMDGQIDQLIVGKLVSSSSIFGTDFTDFTLAALDPQVSFVGRRALVHIEGSLIFWSRQGLMIYKTGTPLFYGKSIRSITDLLREGTALTSVLMGVNSKKGFAIAAYRTTESLNASKIILMDVSEASPFSTIDTSALGHATALQEVELSSGDVVTLIAMSDSKVYTLFVGQASGRATAQTQLIPQDQLQMRKIFRRLRVENAPTNLKYTCTVDDKPFPITLQGVRRMNPIGLTGNQLKIRFVHDGAVGFGSIVLSNYLVEYVVLGESRDYGS